jgi:restriction system protein
MGVVAPDAAELPTATQLAWPTLEVLKLLGGSATNQEILDAVVARLSLSEEQQSIPRADGLTTELYHRLSLARTYLRAVGAVERSQRGVWAITETGRGMSNADMRGIAGRYAASLRAQASGRAEAPGAEEALELAIGDASGEHADSELETKLEETEEAETGWKDRLLGVLRDMDPNAFERLSLRLLREAGFVNTVVTGSVGDGGIDGSGVYRLSLVSFPVYFQCKRYAGSVGADKVRDFRGAMEGRGDKGILITTGTFTSGAKQEATREGARPVDLIDGDQLCDLLKEYHLGLSVETVERVDVNEGFFREI